MSYLSEYSDLVTVISNFDKNLLIIKGWSVTFGLATIALGFKEKARGMFITAAIAAICFWILDAETKWHQTNYYLRMNQIELECQSKGIETCPKIDWAWRESASQSTPFVKSKGPTVDNIEIRNRLIWYVYPHVFLPHVIVLLIGFFFFRKANFDNYVR